VARLVTGLSFMKWIYRANSMCAVRPPADELHDGWSTANTSFPIINSGSRTQAMAEIWKASRDLEPGRASGLGRWLAWWWVSDFFSLMRTTPVPDGRGGGVHQELTVA